MQRERPLGVDAQDGLALAAIKTGVALLPQGAGSEQCAQELGLRIERMKRIMGQVLFHGPNHMAERIEPDHIGGAVGATLGPTQTGAGQVIDDIHAEPVALGFRHDRDHAKDTDSVRDEVRRVFGAHHALTQRGGEKSFETIKHIGAGLCDRDQFCQMHVTGWIEKMHTAKPRLQVLWKIPGQGSDRQPRGIGRQNGIGPDHRHNAPIEIVLPIQAFGDRLDDQVAVGEQAQVMFIVGRLDRVGELRQPEGRRAKFSQPCDRAFRDGSRGRAWRRQIKQHRVDAGIDQMGRDLRAHHARAQHRDSAHQKSLIDCIHQKIPMKHLNPQRRRGEAITLARLCE